MEIQRQYLEEVKQNLIIDIPDEILLSLISSSETEITNYLSKKIPEYDMLLKTMDDVKNKKVLGSSVVNLLRLLDKIYDFFPASHAAMKILREKYGPDYILSCPTFKDKNGNITPLYQLENYEYKLFDEFYKGVYQ